MWIFFIRVAHGVLPRRYFSIVGYHRTWRLLVGVFMGIEGVERLRQHLSSSTEGSDTKLRYSVTGFCISLIHCYTVDVSREGPFVFWDGHTGGTPSTSQAQARHRHEKEIRGSGPRGVYEAPIGSSRPELRTHPVYFRALSAICNENASTYQLASRSFNTHVMNLHMTNGLLGPVHLCRIVRWYDVSDRHCNLPMHFSILLLWIRSLEHGRMYRSCKTIKP